MLEGVGVGGGRRGVFGRVGGVEGVGRARGEELDVLGQGGEERVVDCAGGGG